ncbi:MAG TPA: hypothetical protein VKE74_09870, partial [Gemmataceae bacterium]|nr:hypothetical protein [Gemmataceae bacterium]
PINPALYTLPFTVSIPPDDVMGAATQYATFLFGIYLAPRPLIGEPTQQLPKNICIDLNVSQPRGSNGPPVADYDIVFAPNGQVLYWSEGQINLWVRDYTKVPTPPGPLVVTSAGPPVVYDLTPFRKGGEQQIVALKTKSGALGVFPVTWPQADGTYPLISAGPPATYQDPYYFARLGATAPSQ